MRPSTEGPGIGRSTRLLVDKPVGGTQPSLRSKEGCVSVSALTATPVRKSGELQDISSVLVTVLVHLFEGGCMHGPIIERIPPGGSPPKT